MSALCHVNGRLNGKTGTRTLNIRVQRPMSKCRYPVSSIFHGLIFPLQALPNYILILHFLIINMTVTDTNQVEHEQISTSLEVEKIEVNLFRSKSLWLPVRARGVFGG